MSNELVQIIKEQTEILLHNAKTMLLTCNMEYVLCDVPVLKHAYHMLHSCDRWFINPERYEEPPAYSVLLQNILVMYFPNHV